MTTRRDVLLSIAAAAALPGTALAQSRYPDKPVKIIVPFAPGGSTDIVAQILAPKMGELLGQPVIVENRSGAGGTIGGEAIARATPDGYTLGMATVSVTGTAPAVYKNLKYDPRKDFTPIVKLVNVPGVIVVHPSFPAKNFAEFMKVVRASPGKYDYASSGAGAVGHMGMELFKLRTGTFMTHIPYRGAGPALADVLGGSVPIMWDNLASSIPHVRSGRLVAIGLANDKRVPQLPDLPTFAELGVKNYDAATWFGILGPAGLPADVVTKVNDAANKALADAGIRNKLVEQTAYPVGGSPDVLARQMRDELAKWAEVAKFAKVEL